MADQGQALSAAAREAIESQTIGGVFSPQSGQRITNVLRELEERGRQGLATPGLITSEEVAPFLGQGGLQDVSPLDVSDISGLNARIQLANAFRRGAGDPLLGTLAPEPLGQRKVSDSIATRLAQGAFRLAPAFLPGLGPLAAGALTAGGTLGTGGTPTEAAIGGLLAGTGREFLGGAPTDSGLQPVGAEFGAGVDPLTGAGFDPFGGVSLADTSLRIPTEESFFAGFGGVPAGFGPQLDIPTEADFFGDTLGATAPISGEISPGIDTAGAGGIAEAVRGFGESGVPELLGLVGGFQDLEPVFPQPFPPIGQVSVPGIGDSTFSVLPDEIETPQEIKRPEALPIPSSLQGLSPLQQTTALATQGQLGGGLGAEGGNIFLNLLQRRLIDTSGEVSPFSDVTPIEQAFLQQGFGLRFDPNTKSLLESIAGRQ